MATYEATLLDGHVNAGDETFEAGSISEACDLAEIWAKDGDWDHPASIILVVVGSDGTEERYEIEVGEPRASR